MPPKRRVAKKRKNDRDADIVEYFVGRSARRFFGELEPFGRPPDREIEHDAWRRLGSQVVEQFITTQPGERPSAWWTYEATEPRGYNESQSEYFDRLNLWSDGERQRWQEIQDRLEEQEQQRRIDLPWKYQDE